MDERDERIIHAVQESAPKLPKCAGCKHQPLNFLQNLVAMQNGAVCSVIWCADCGYVITMQYLGQNQQAGPRIIVPN